MTVDADGEATESVTIENADELKTRKVSEGGQVYLGKKYGGKTVTVAFRVEEENDVSEPEDSNN